MRGASADQVQKLEQLMPGRAPSEPGRAAEGGGPEAVQKKRKAAAPVG